MGWQDYVQDDHHAGAIVGMVIGVSFLVVGACTEWVPESDGSPISFHRKAGGITLILLGLIAVVASSVYLAQPTYVSTPQWKQK